MGKLKKEIAELNDSLVAAQAKYDQAEMQHRELSEQLMSMMYEAVDDGDEEQLDRLIHMFMEGESLRSQNSHLINVSQVYLSLLKELDEVQSG